MKRHISIFTFLLGAFAAGFASEAGADQTVYGGYYYIGENYQGSSIERVTVNGSRTTQQAVLALNASATCAVNKEPDGTKVSDWWYVEGDTTVRSWIQTFKNLILKGDSSRKRECVWKNEKDTPAYVAIAVQFDYIKYNVAYDANGGTPKPDSVVNQPYNENFTLAAAPAKTGYTFAKWKASSNSELFGAGSSVNGSSLGLADCHVDGSNVTMTAQWAANAYFVSCEPNGGSWPGDYAPPERAIYDTVFSLPAPTRTGYDFIGWKVTSGLDTTTAKWGKGESPSSSVLADTLCVNGENEVYFKNLNPTDNAAVMLTAQWKAKTITVSFNNHGGGSGGGIKDTLDVTYDAAYDALNPPTKGGNVFLGYEIDGVPYWNDEGQPMKLAWDIPTNCTADAKWNKLAYQLTYNENRSDGTESKIEIRDFEYGKPTKLYDGADFSNLGCTLLGWSTNSKATKPDDGCEIGGTAIFVDSTTLYAVWEKNYFIAYDGNGATNETPMAVQKFVFGKSGQSLNPNIYGKVGYTFYGWATNRAAALLLKSEYEDQAILTRDLAKTLGETNTLFAVWRTNTYYVAFDMNGGTDAAPDVLTCAYDNPVSLPWTKKDGSAFANGAYYFLGWSNDVAKVIYTDREASVSNLCATANGTNTLYAVWKLSELSAAMHCDNLRWESYQKVGETTRDNPWYPGSEGVYQYGDRSAHQQWLVAEVQTNGTISFDWKPNLCETREDQMILWVGLEKDAGETSETKVFLKGDDGKWNSFVKTDVPAGSFIHIYVRSLEGDCTIDRMTWTPGGREPTDADKVTISSAAVVGGKFSLSFESKAEFDYNLLTNANLLINSWGVMTNEVGTGETITFEPQIIEGQPQMFYRVDTIRKK